MIEITAEFLASQGLSPSLPRRFWPKVRKTDSCWLWTGGTTPDGYGKVWSGLVNERNRPIGWFRTHRIAWILTRGPIPEGLQVLHNCPVADTPLCVCPEHLWLGTHLENMKDGVEKHQFVNGEGCHLHKLTREKVEEIRALWETGAFSQQALANRFGIAQTGISAMVLHKTWDHTMPPPRAVRRA